ncbi:3-keto-5-aminohexanoate cleavage protein [Oricola sp.]|uniref:3-keto-5-aminohexanoate cleavage protein n=1 Tax=Oricola sp. TaxID=1979950 RepID=UPI003BA8774F
MAILQPLPTIMVAPNGARLTKADHPALPITIAEIVATARRCHAAGADGLHAHVRDIDGKHVLDAGLYRELGGEMRRAVPEMAVQITTEAVGLYSPGEQMAVVRAVQPNMVSIAVREIAVCDAAALGAFFAELEERGTAVQHIIYTPDDIALLRAMLPGVTTPQLLFVLGRYTEGQVSQPDDLDPFLAALAATGWQADWAVCAFGRRETECLAHGSKHGGKVRVGFENNCQNADGSTAADNAERVREIAQLLR